MKPIHLFLIAVSIVTCFFGFLWMMQAFLFEDTFYLMHSSAMGIIGLVVTIIEIIVHLCSSKSFDLVFLFLYGLLLFNGMFAFFPAPIFFSGISNFFD